MFRRRWEATQFNQAAEGLVPAITAVLEEMLQRDVSHSTRSETSNTLLLASKK
jgi:hypothetical protein